MNEPCSPEPPLRSTSGVVSFAERRRAVLTSVAWLGLAAHAAFLPISIAGMQIGLALALAAVIALYATGVRPSVRSPFVSATLLLCAAAALSVVVAGLTGSPPPSARSAFHWRALAAPIVVLFVLRVHDTPGAGPSVARARALRLVVIWATAALLPSIVAWIQVRNGFDPFYALGLRDAPRFARSPVSPDAFVPIGFFKWYTRLAHALTPVALVAGALALCARVPRSLRFLLGVSSLASGAAVVLTQSRSAWAGLAVGGVIVAAWSNRRTARIAVPVAIAAALAVAAASPGLRARLSTAMTPAANSDRATIWRVCGAMIEDRPLTGFGWGALPARSVPYYERIAPDYPLRAWCHDVFLTAWAEGGPLLLLAVLAWIALLARFFLRALRAGDDLARAASAGGLATLAALVVNGLVHDMLSVSEPLYAMMFAFAVAATLSDPSSDAAPRPEHVSGSG